MLRNFFIVFQSNILSFIFYFNFGHNEKLSEDKPNEYGWVFDHEDMLRMIRQYGNRG